ncbi:MAG: hypothetical protein AAB403_18540, partial [Planctomycetota bacterium]
AQFGAEVGDVFFGQIARHGRFPYTLCTVLSRCQCRTHDRSPIPSTSPRPVPYGGYLFVAYAVDAIDPSPLI